MLVIGDSTACTMLPGIVVVSPHYGVQTDNGSVVGCGIVSDTLAPYFYGSNNLSAGTKYCGAETLSTELTALRRDSPNIVVWSSIWERTAILGPANQNFPAGSSGWRSLLVQRMTERVAQFESEGAFTVMLTEPPIPEGGGTAAPTQTDRAFSELNSLIRQFAAEHPNEVGLVDLAAHLCPKGPPCPYVIGHLIVRPDGEHFSYPSSLWLAKWLVPQIINTYQSAYQQALSASAKKRR